VCPLGILFFHIFFSPRCLGRWCSTYICFLKVGGCVGDIWDFRSLFHLEVLLLSLFFPPLLKFQCWLASFDSTFICIFGKFIGSRFTLGGLVVFYFNFSSFHTSVWVVIGENSKSSSRKHLEKCAWTLFFNIISDLSFDCHHTWLRSYTCLGWVFGFMNA
jgi:hypothetical protein